MNTSSYFLLLILGLSFMFSSCTYRTGEDNPNPGCMNPATVSYSNDVLDVLTPTCLGCHDQAGNAGGIVFDTYAGLKVVVDNGTLEGAINHRSGFEAMPRNNPKLADCTLELIQSWIDAGAPNN